VRRRRAREVKRPTDSDWSRWASWATILAVPLALVGLALAYLAVGGEKSSGSKQTTGRADLERIDLIPRNGNLSIKPGVEMLVHNAGLDSSVVSRARIEVLAVHRLPLCYTQGDLPLSEGYDVQLSGDAAQGDVVEAPLHQQIGSLGNDRFRINLGVDDAGGEEGRPFPGVYLFELNVAIAHDGLDEPLSMGTVLLSIPEVPMATLYYLREGELADLEDSYNGARYYTPREMWSSTMPCWEANAEALMDIERSSADGSRELEEALREAVVPSFSEAES
jgi:hypothetical protein